MMYLSGNKLHCLVDRKPAKVSPVPVYLYGHQKKFSILTLFA